MEDRLLCRALISFIFERKAIKSINNNRIFQVFLDCHRHFERDRNNVELMLLFHDEVLPNLHQFDYPNPDELAYYEEYNYDNGLGSVLRNAMSDSQRYPVDSVLRVSSSDECTRSVKFSINLNYRMQTLLILRWCAP